MHGKISAGVVGGLSGGSSVRRTSSEDPHRRQQNFFLEIILFSLLLSIVTKIPEVVVVGFQNCTWAPN